MILSANESQASTFLDQSGGGFWCRTRRCLLGGQADTLVTAGWSDGGRSHAGEDNSTSCITALQPWIVIICIMYCYETDDFILLFLLVKTILIGFSGESYLLHFVIARFRQ